MFGSEIHYTVESIDEYSIAMTGLSCGGNFRFIIIIKYSYKYFKGQWI